MNGFGKACGKFILAGEHFVVDGSTPAIAFPLKELWCEVEVAPDVHPRYTAHYEGVERTNEDEDLIKTLMSRATYAAVDTLRVNTALQPIRVASRANFPVSRGFGSSAAFSIALSQALLDYRSKIDPNWELADPHREVARAAAAVERVFHGNPSGVDTAVILKGAPIRFQRKKQDGEPELWGLTNRAADFVLADGGSRDTSRELVERVAALRAHDPALWEKLRARMRDCVSRCEEALASPVGATALAESVRDAHAVLAELGLSTSRIDEIIEAAVKNGALAGKDRGIPVVARLDAEI
ncbi:MAG: hypothetical protein HYW49_07185 [Deltaproteobacteria bacterium]|nr:hypothetical protein [Deltaproteobacteria bacterium]